MLILKRGPDYPLKYLAQIISFYSIFDFIFPTSLINHIIILFANMMNNTTLMIFAVVAALGLMTTLLVVQPNIPQAFAQGQSQNKFKVCKIAPNAEERPPQCAD
jgi:hypothetical protein